MAMEKAVISGVAFNPRRGKITVHDVPDRPGVAYAILGRSPTRTSTSTSSCRTSATTHDDMTFTVHRNDYPKAMKILRGRCSAHQVPRRERRRQDRQGIDRRPGHALARRHRRADVRTLARGHQHPDDLDLEIKITVVIEEKYAELAVARAAQGLELDRSKTIR